VFHTASVRRCFIGIRRVPRTKPREPMRQTPTADARSRLTLEARPRDCLARARVSSFSQAKTTPWVTRLQRDESATPGFRDCVNARRDPPSTKSLDPCGNHCHRPIETTHHLVRRKKPNTPSVPGHVRAFVRRIERPRYLDRHNAERSPPACLPLFSKPVQFVQVSGCCQFIIAGRKPFSPRLPGPVKVASSANV
jgi:hypothetical protein